MKFLTHPYPVPKLETVGLYLYSPIHFHGVGRDNFTNILCKLSFRMAYLGKLNEHEYCTFQLWVLSEQTAPKVSIKEKLNEKLLYCKGRSNVTEIPVILHRHVTLLPVQMKKYFTFRKHCLHMLAYSGS